jgi:formylglycine-generating enzyme
MITRIMLVLGLCFFFCGVHSAFAACPSMDFNGDCFVDLADFAVFISQWLTGDGIPAGMVHIPGGTFQMGDSVDGMPAALPVHTVTLSPFFMSVHETTIGEYCIFLNSALSQGSISIPSNIVYQAGTGTSFPYCDTSAYSLSSHIQYSGGVFTVTTKAGRDMSNDPMVMVSWYGAAAYCNWRSQQEGKELCYNLATWACDITKYGYRLATEAEWEYSARGGLSGKRFPWGDTIAQSQVNYFSYWSGGVPFYPYDVSLTQGFHPNWTDGIMPYTSPVGTFAPNAYGLYDTTGNVWEWCNDWYDVYSSGSQTNPTGPVTGTNRVMRGGSWGDDAAAQRLAYHAGVGPVTRYYSIGFRVVQKY